MGWSKIVSHPKASDKLSQALADRENKSDLIAGLDLDDIEKDVSDILIDLSRRETKNSSINFAELFVDQLNKDAENRLRTGGGLFGKKPGLPFGDNAEENTSGVGIGMPINPYLWKGSLETVSFMPLQSADPFGGIIIIFPKK